jgi:hypothetical protein
MLWRGPLNPPAVLWRSRSTWVSLAPQFHSGAKYRLGAFWMSKSTLALAATSFGLTFSAPNPTSPKPPNPKGKPMHADA